MKQIILCLALLWGSVSALPRFQSFYQYARDFERLKHDKPAAPNDDSVVFFTQRLDHYDRQVQATWQQRSFQNDTFFDGTGPVFLCVGGEGPPLDPSVLISSVHCNDMVELAPQVGALMVALEHRYYGESMPTGREFSTHKLRWLSSQQALGDLAEFHSQIVANYSLTPSNKWISFGGSYPGMMSGFFRLKFPHLVHGAISSSAPWNATLDMQVYQDIVGDSLAVQSVGGSDECKATVVDGHQTIAEMIKTEEGRRQVAQTFNFCSEDTLATEEIAGRWAANGVIEVPSQENDPACTTPDCDIARICETMGNLTDASDLDKLAAVSYAQRSGQCIGVDELEDDRVTMKLLGNTANSARSWPYQTCTEFAFYQTCEFGSRCPFVQGYNNLSNMIATCDRLFGITPDQVATQVEFSNAYYGASMPAGTRIMFPNGNVDPWSGLGVLKSPDNNVSEPVYMADGASHHAWTHPADTIVQPSVQQAKIAVQNQVLEWLAQD